MKTIEFRVRPVTRYMITRFEKEMMSNDRCRASSDVLGEFDNKGIAERVRAVLEASIGFGTEAQKFLLFAAPSMSEQGGASDFQMRGTLDECKAYIDMVVGEQGWQHVFAQIVDPESMEVVLCPDMGVKQTVPVDWESPEVWRKKEEAKWAARDKETADKKAIYELRGELAKANTHYDEFASQLNAAADRGIVDRSEADMLIARYKEEWIEANEEQ